MHINTSTNIEYRRDVEVKLDNSQLKLLNLLNTVDFLYTDFKLVDHLLVL